MAKGRTAASGFVLLLCVATLVPSSTSSPTAILGAAHRETIVPEPAPAAAFLSAFRRGDEATAENVASPLYRQEWSRRKISVQERQSWLPSWHRGASSTADWLDVSYVDGMIEPNGQTHLFYIGRSVNDGSAGTATVWRLDADSAGRVVWIEVVWMFSTPGTQLTRLSEPQATTASTPPAFQRMRPESVVGVRTVDGWEGYYAVRYQAADTLVVNFFGIDEYGSIRPGVWTYQRRA